jgi:hypothetical protein
MRPGPADLRGSVAVGARVEVTRGRQVLAVDVPVRDVVLDVTADRVVPGKLEFTAPMEWTDSAGGTVRAVDHPLSPLSNFGQRAHATALLDVDGTPSEVELGWFQIDTWEPGDGDTVQVTALDLMQTLVEAPMTWPSSPPAGASLLSELRRLCNVGEGHSLPVVLDDPVDRGIPRTFEWGTDRAEAVRDLCESYGLEYGVKPDGYLHVWAQRDGRAPVATYTARDLLLSAPRQAVERRANRIVVVGSKTEGDVETQWVAQGDATEPPYSISEYGLVASRFELNSADGQTAVTAAMQTRLRNLALTTRTRSLEIAMDPRLEVGDVIAAVTDDETIVGRITAYSVSLSDPSSRMRVDVQELNW